MQKILLCDSDTALLKIMQVYLSWYGFEVTGLESSGLAAEQLLISTYDLFVCDHLSKPVNAYFLCEKIRCSDKPQLRNLKILMTACGNVELEDYKFLRRMNIHFMSKLQSPEKWFEKISSILIVDTKNIVPVTV